MMRFDNVAEHLMPYLEESDTQPQFPRRPEAADQTAI